MSILDIGKLGPSDNLQIPFADGGVRAGFPSMAQDTVDRCLDLNSLVMSHPSTTFCARVKGDSMIGAGVYDGDILVIDRSLEPRDGDMAVCFVDGEFTLKFIEIADDCLWLRPANPDYPKIKVTEDNDFVVWGVVTYTIYKRR